MGLSPSRFSQLTWDCYILMGRLDSLLFCYHAGLPLRY